MRIAAHQPCYLPWPGYFHKMAAVDKFVYLDDAQYTRGQHFNRTKILVQGKAQWLSVPVHFAKGPINQINVVDNGWIKKHRDTIQQSYARAPHSELINRFVDNLYAISSTCTNLFLVDVDNFFLGILYSTLSISTEVYMASEIDYKPATRTQRLVNICKALDADTYVSGTGGSKKYLDLELFHRNGITVEWQSFKCKPYPQVGDQPFVAGLSILDVIASLGVKDTIPYLLECGKTESAQ